MTNDPWFESHSETYLYISVIVNPLCFFKWITFELIKFSVPRSLARKYTPSNSWIPGHHGLMRYTVITFVTLCSYYAFDSEHCRLLLPVISNCLYLRALILIDWEADSESFSLGDFAVIPQTCTLLWVVNSSQHSHNAILLWNFQKYSVRFIYAIIDWVVLGFPK